MSEFSLSLVSGMLLRWCLLHCWSFLSRFVPNCTNSFWCNLTNKPSNQLQKFPSCSRELSIVCKCSIWFQANIHHVHLVLREDAHPFVMGNCFVSIKFCLNCYRFVFSAIVHKFCQEFQVHVPQDKTHHSIHAEFIGWDLQPGFSSNLPTRICLYQTASDSP